MSVLVALFALLVAVAAALWWWAGTEGSLDWTVRQIARSQPLTAEGVRGSLRSGLHFDRLQWERDGLKVEAWNLSLAWQPLALIRGTLQLDQVRAERLRVDDRRPPKPSVIPVSLVIPIRVTLIDAQVGQVQWVAAANSFEASGLAGNYTFNGTHHKLDLASLQWGGGSYRGHASVGAQGVLPVDAMVEGQFESPVPGSPKKLPLSFNASLRGPLADMEANAMLQTRAFTPTVPTRATATARLTPWAAQPVPQAQAQFRQLDLNALWPQAPRTSLSGSAEVQPAGTQTWAVTADIDNAQPGPWDQNRLPLDRLHLAGEWRQSGQALVRDLDARVGGGRVQATGNWRGSDGWTVQGKLAGVNPALLYSAMAPLPLSGRADLTGQGKAVAFDVDLQAQGGAPARASGNTKAGSNSRSGSNSLAAAVRGLELRQAQARGRWQDGTLQLPMLEVRSADAQLHATLELRPQARAGSGRIALEAPGLTALAEGRLAEASGAGTLRATGSDLARALGWLGRLPGVPAALSEQIAGGRGEAQLAWQGGWRDPAVQATLALPLLQLRPQVTASMTPQAAASAPAWVLRDGAATLNGRLSDATLQASGRGELAQRRVALDLAGRLGRRGTPAVWQGQLASLNATASDPATGAGNWTLGLRNAVDWRFAAGSLDVAAGEAVLTAPPRARTPAAGSIGASAGPAADAPALLAWEPLRWRTGELRTAGRITGLPLAWIELVGGPQLAGSMLSGDMVFDAQWDANLGATPRIRASLARSRGDVTVLAETAEGASTRVRAGVREARLSVTTEGESVNAVLRWDSERGGTADGQLTTRLSRGGDSGWRWAEDAPLTGRLRAQLPRIGVWSLLAPPGWRLRGSLATDVTVAGTRADPRLAGTVAADDLALRSVVDGIELQAGRLRAHLDGRRLLIDEFVLRGAGAGGGTLMATGQGDWTPAGVAVRMEAQLNRLRASNRSDRQLTVSGTIAARHDGEGSVVRGNLRIDQALILLPEESPPKLGDDVVVRDAAAPVTRTEARQSEQAARPPSRRIDVEVAIDMGDDFRVRGHGIDTRLRGTVALSGQSLTSPRLVGTIQAAGGEYRAYGQRLNIERGVIRFTGPIDNPALDILAIRPNLSQRVGVMISGRALAPFVRLYSEPDLPEAEKLSWLVTGRASPSTGAEAALLQQAGLALLAGRSGSGKRGVAAALGLDELSFRREGAGGGPSVTLGKRFGRNFYAAYERSLSGALGTLFIFYELTQRMTVRAQAGERTAVDLIFTFAFD